MREIRINMPYIIALAVVFYLLPAFMKDTAMAMVLMLAAMPAAVFITALIRGIKKGFSFVLVALTALLFLPTVFIWYNSSALVYTAFYAVIAAAGCGLGGFLYGKR